MHDPIESADEAGLVYVSDSQPGFQRRKRGKGFTYLDERGQRVTDARQRQRIDALVIPPAWRDVWICKRANGHLQATGRDARGRKQYRYHEKWTTCRNESKFERMSSLARKLPLLKKRVEEDLTLPGLSREKVLAAVVKIMLLTQTRVGNSVYAEENESYGLTTILNEHARVRGAEVKLSFVGKSGVDHRILFNDAVLAKVIRRCQQLPGEELFAYQTGAGETVDVTSTSVNEYLKSITGEEFSAKDLRTWGGTCKATEILVRETITEEILTFTERKWAKRHLGVIKGTAKYLRNTVAVCRKYYIHPTVFEADRRGVLHKKWKTARSTTSLTREERLVSLLLSA